MVKKPPERRVYLPPWTQPLRDWQHTAVEAWAKSTPACNLAVVTPGGGKTLYAAAIAYGALASKLIDQVIVVVPSDHLRSQTAMVFAGVGIELDPLFSNSSSAIARDLLGAVVTYAQVGLDPETFVRLLGSGARRERRTLVVLDEIHHAGDEATWGASVRRAFTSATFIVGLSGTPFRSDESRVSFVEYDRDGRVAADVVYGYQDALRDGVVRPLVFHRQGGEVAWVNKDGLGFRHTFADRLAADLSRQRLRAALRDAEWVTEVLTRAHTTLEGLRRTDHDAAGLIVAINEAHARWIAQLMQKAFGIYPVVVSYMDVESGEKIQQFSVGRAPWLITVRMVTEGVDIPRARVLCYLSNVQTEMFFLQMVGRVVRARAGVVAPAYVMLPDDPVLRRHAEIVERYVHEVRRVDPAVSGAITAAAEHLPPEATPPPAVAAAPHKAATEADRDARWRDDPLRTLDAIHAEAGTLVGRVSAQVIDDLPRRSNISIVRIPQPLPASLRHTVAAAPIAAASPVETGVPLRAINKAALRKKCNELAKQVAARFGVDHRNVHGLLKRRDGVHLDEATEAQLLARQRSMETWLREAFFPK